MNRSELLAQNLGILCVTLGANQKLQWGKEITVVPCPKTVGGSSTGECYHGERDIASFVRWLVFFLDLIIIFFLYIVSLSTIYY